MVTKFGEIVRKLFDLSDGNGGNSFSKVSAFVVLLAAIIFIPLHVISNSHEEMVMLGLIGATFGNNIAKAVAITMKGSRVPE
jgi:hypothetical protein